MIDQSTTPATPRPRLSATRRSLARRFSLLTDKAADAEIERRIREGVELRGATPWILMFAILVASIGLNVNSTAVIIGAMLISPLMGPIMGFGLGVAVYDFALIRTSLWNIAIASVISLGVSALYFSITPLSEAQSELLARTSPTLWDVLIALVGGMAGIIGITREEKSNVIPGVAIATALMPPLCTAGYGLATGQWSYFGGALYLYSINCVFIALATLIGLRLVRLPAHSSVDMALERRLRVGLWMLAIATALPSAWLAYRLVQQEIFRSHAATFVHEEFSFDKTHVADTYVDASERRVEVSLIGLPLDAATLQRIERRLAPAGLPGAKLLVHQAGEYDQVDISALKSSLLSDLYRDSQEALQRKQAELVALRAQLAARDALMDNADALVAELRALEPGIEDATIHQGFRFTAEGEKTPTTQVTVHTAKPMSADERERLHAWMRARTGQEQMELVSTP